MLKAGSPCTTAYVPRVERRVGRVRSGENRMSRPGGPTGTPPAYRFALLAPTKKAVEQSGVLGPQTLGIEVTVPALAAACALGNIDPQHTAGGDGRAAIEAALAWPLPDAGSTLVT